MFGDALGFPWLDTRGWAVEWLHSAESKSPSSHSTASGWQRLINTFSMVFWEEKRIYKYLELFLGPLSVPSPSIGFGDFLMLLAGMWLCFCYPSQIYIIEYMTYGHAEWLNCSSSSQTPPYTPTKLWNYRQVHFLNNGLQPVLTMNSVSKIPIR